MPAIVLVRHAQASFGSADYDVLSELGERQVQALLAGLERRRIRPTRVLSGTLRRQRDTAAPLAASAGVELELDPRWAEYSDRDILAHHAEVPAGLEHRSGDAPLDSRQFQAILNRALLAWIAAGDAGPCEEPWPAFHGRLCAALDALTDSLGQGETAVVISSGGAIAALTTHLMGLPADALVALNHVSINTALTKVTVGRGGTTVVSINEHAHLDEADDAPISYR